MSIEQEITRLVNAKAAFKSWLTAKGVSVPKDALLPSMVDYWSVCPQAEKANPPTLRFPTIRPQLLPHTDRTALFPFRESRM